ncbi:unnamed protein product [Acanthoscelides obtectus]|nr:unnamed protein product [Acanthoscelides obtectus]CAK1638347.1 Transcriptional regulator ATRX homolog [Acanthoscelides obtectus]
MSKNDEVVTSILEYFSTLKIFIKEIDKLETRLTKSKGNKKRQNEDLVIEDIVNVVDKIHEHNTKIKEKLDVHPVVKNKKKKKIKDSTKNTVDDICEKETTEDQIDEHEQTDEKEIDNATNDDNSSEKSDPLETTENGNKTKSNEAPTVGEKTVSDDEKRKDLAGQEKLHNGTRKSEGHSNESKKKSDNETSTKNDEQSKNMDVDENNDSGSDSDPLRKSKAPVPGDSDKNEDPKAEESTSSPKKEPEDIKPQIRLVDLNKLLDPKPKKSVKFDSSLIIISSDEEHSPKRQSKDSNGKLKSALKNSPTNINLKAECNISEKIEEGLKNKKKGGLKDDLKVVISSSDSDDKAACDDSENGNRIRSSRRIQKNKSKVEKRQEKLKTIFKRKGTKDGNTSFEIVDSSKKIKLKELMLKLSSESSNSEADSEEDTEEKTSRRNRRKGKQSSNTKAENKNRRKLYVPLPKIECEKLKEIYLRNKEILEIKRLTSLSMLKKKRRPSLTESENSDSNGDSGKPTTKKSKIASNAGKKKKECLDEKHSSDDDDDTLAETFTKSLEKPQESEIDVEKAGDEVLAEIAMETLEKTEEGEQDESKNSSDSDAPLTNKDKKGKKANEKTSKQKDDKEKDVEKEDTKEKKKGKNEEDPEADSGDETGDKLDKVADKEEEHDVDSKANDKDKKKKDDTKASDDEQEATTEQIIDESLLDEHNDQSSLNKGEESLEKNEDETSKDDNGKNDASSEENEKESANNKSKEDEESDDDDSGTKKKTKSGEKKKKVAESEDESDNDTENKGKENDEENESDDEKENKKKKSDSDEEDSDEAKKKEKKKWRNDKLLREKIDSTDSEEETKKFTNKKKKKEKNNSDSDDDEPVVKKTTKGKSKRKVKKPVLSDSDESGKEKKDKDSTDDESEEKSDSSNDEDDKKKEEEEESKKKPNKRRIKQVKDSSSDEDEDKSTRKHIRKVIDRSSLQESTIKAEAEEKKRKARIAEKQKKYNAILEDVQNSKIEQLLLEYDEKNKKDLLPVHKHFISKLKPHQANGVRFMWDACFESLDRCDKEGSGCILAHCMGLGKTLQVITLSHTLLTHSKKTGVSRVMVVCPINTVLNWKAEFKQWVPKNTPFEVYELTSCRLNSERQYYIKEWFDEGGVLIIGYTMFRMLSNPDNKKISKKIRAVFQEGLVNPGPDLVVCDEGHLLKNEKTNLSIAMNRIRTKRRIVLTGTPLQNNLKEYWCMVQFIKPNLLGTYKEYLNRFVNPITNGQYTDSTQHDIVIMRKRSHVLHKLLDGVVQRRDYSVLEPYLPPKHEFVLFVKLSEVQVKIYKHYMERYARRGDGVSNKTSFLFTDFQNLQRICTHPRALGDRNYDKSNKDYDDEESEGSLKDFIDDDGATPSSSSDSSSESGSDSRGSKSGSDKDGKSKKKYQQRSRVTRALAAQRRENNEDSDPELEEIKEVKKEWWQEFCDDEGLENINNSGKLFLLFQILKECEEIGDKVLVFSQSLFTLNCIEYFLEKVDEATQNGETEKIGGLSGSWALGLDYFRLDGSSSCDNRATWCNSFNDPENTRARLFLISTKAGGLGINLVAANRVIIFDVSWNPSHDIQSIYRVYRFGQTKPCYIYRFVTFGAMEMKIYERQVTKQAISKRVIDEQQIDRHYNQNDLQELYKCEVEPEEDRPIPLVPKDVLLGELLQKLDKTIYKYHMHQSLLENKTDEGLNEEERKAAWEEFESEKVLRKTTSTWNAMGASMGLPQLPMNAQTIAAALTNIVRKDNPGWNEVQIKGIIPALVRQLQVQMSENDMSMYTRVLQEIEVMQAAMRNQMTEAMYQQHVMRAMQEQQRRNMMMGIPQRAAFPG